MSDTKINTITVHELKLRRDSDPNLCLIDVRETHEWEKMRIPGAHHMPKDDLPKTIETLVHDRLCPIYLHCQGGVRSLQAASALIGLGYEYVYSIDGGIREWAMCGYPIEP